MKKKHFTLIELLVVIAVIAILMGILLPAIGMVRSKAKEAKARAEINAIVTAIKAFDAEYGRLPKSDSDTGIDDVDDNNYFKPEKIAFKSLKTAYYELMDVLTFSFHTDSSKTPSSKATGLNSDELKFIAEQNPKSTAFLEAPSKYFGLDNTKNGFRDPWGRAYGIFLDSNYDKKINATDAKKKSDPSGDLWLNTNVAVFSWGAIKDGVDDSDRLIRSWDN